MGISGTPIFADNAFETQFGKRTTSQLFDICLHKYLIIDAINDGNVLPFKVAYIGEYKDKNGNQIDFEVNGIDIEELLTNKKRLSVIKDFVVANHATFTYAKQYTSIFACASIETLCKYYELFRDDTERQNRNISIAAVFSTGAHDASTNSHGNLIHHADKLEEYVQDYNNRFGTTFSTNDQNGFDIYNRHISQQVKAGKIDILLVVNMYLTGFDSQLLNTLYVDKNLKHHGLIQAFSRTNRLHSQKKQHGNIYASATSRRKWMKP